MKWRGASLALFLAAACGEALEARDCAEATAESCSVARAMLLPETLPASPGNAYGDSDAAAYLGLALFFDGNLGQANFSCASCHLPELAFTDRKEVSVGVGGTGRRNAPTTFNAARLSVIFWDGSADSLWSQPLFAIENPLEMASTRLELVHHVADDARLRPLYESAFEALPDMSSWPLVGKPGDAAFDELGAETQHDVNQVVANVGKALDAYMRKNGSGRAPFDAWLLGDETAIIDAAKTGFGIFLESGCADCHGGPMLTDERFHDVGFPSRQGAEPDQGAAAGLAILNDNIFNLAGPFADQEALGTHQSQHGDRPNGAFRTPSLRNVVLTGPYGHDGALATLPETLALHAPDVAELDRGYIIAFLQTLTGSHPPRPWSNWPIPQ